MWALSGADVGAVWSSPPNPPLLERIGHLGDGPFKVLDEAESKDLLTKGGIPVPLGQVVRSPEDAAAAAGELGYPIVVKALGIPHKTDVGGLRLNLDSADEVSAAVSEMSSLSESYLVEKMVEGVVAELIVGIAHDEQFGPYLVVGGGGVLVELMKDSESLLMPTTREKVQQVLGQLKCAPLFSGFRGTPPADLNAAVDVILAVAEMVETASSSIIELDINPLILLAEGQGVVAADALIILNANPRRDPARVNEPVRIASNARE